jgi:Ca2+-binding EF-hand superfamily protein
MRKVMLLLALLFALSSAAPTPLEPALEPALKELRSEDSSAHGKRMLHVAYTLTNHFAPKHLTLNNAQEEEYMLRNFFDWGLDINHDGFISPAELLHYFNFGIARHVDEIISWADIDSDGKVNYAEFLLEVTGTYHYELMHSLNSIDTNQDGFISSDELLGYFNVDIEKQVYEIMGIADIDRDGKVNYQEYLTVMSETGTCSLPRIPTTVSRPRGNLLTCRLLSPLASQPRPPRPPRRPRRRRPRPHRRPCPRHSFSFTYQPVSRGRLTAPRARLSAAISQASTAPRRMPLCWPSLNPQVLGSARLTL